MKAEWAWNKVFQDPYEKAKKDNEGLHAWNFVMYLDPYTWKLMHLVLALDLDYCRWSKEWIWVWSNAKQCDSAPSCICQQKPIECRVVMQQYWMGNPWHTTWSRKVSPLPLMKEIYVIVDCNPLVAMISKDIAILSQQLQCIMLCIHQYIVCIYTNLVLTYT